MNVDPASGRGAIVDRLYKPGVRQPAIRYFTWMVCAAIPVAGVAFFLGNPWHFLICLAALYILVMPYALYFAIAIQMITPSHLRGRMTGFMMVAIPIFSQGLGPMVIGALTDFVCRDPQKIGHTFAVLSISGLVGAFLFLRLALARADRPQPAAP